MCQHRGSDEMKRPKRLQISGLGRDKAAQQMRVERHFEKKVRHLSWRIDPHEGRLLAQLHRRGPSDPHERKANVSVHECDEFNIGPEITGPLRMPTMRQRDTCGSTTNLLSRTCLGLAHETEGALELDSHVLGEMCR